MTVSSGPGWQLLQGDASKEVSSLEEASVHSVVTSPPYWQLRDYKADGQMGLEPTLEQWIEKLVAVFREVRRALRKDGTVWLNLGDSYASAWAIGRRNLIGNKGRTNRLNRMGGDLKEKDLIGAPWAAAFALRADGWWLRSDIVWSKPNPMPESVQDRPTRAHEYIFLLSKAANYYYDAAAIRREVAVMSKGAANKKPDAWDMENGRHGGIHRKGRTMRAQRRGHVRCHEGFDERWDRMTKDEQCARGGNKRTVWEVATAPYPGPHFATFPPPLIVPCIRAGCPEGGTVLDPFAGTSTTGQVALENGRKYIGIDVDPKSIKLSEKRLRSVAMQPSLL